MRSLNYLNKGFLIILLFTAFSTFGQCFDADDRVGCPPHSITITNCGDPLIPVFYDYGDGSGISFNNTHTYNTPGNYTVTQYAGTGANIDTLKKEAYISILDNPIPRFTLYNCVNNSIQLTIDEDIYDEYIVDFNDGPSETLNGFETTTKIYPSSFNQTVTVTGTYLEASCTNQNTERTMLFDNMTPANTTKVEVISNTEVRLTSEIISVHEYKVKQRLQGESTFEVIDTIPVGASFSIYSVTGLDTDNNVYEFELETFDRCGNTTSSNLVSSIPLNLSTTSTSIDADWESYSGTFDHFELVKNSSSSNIGASENFSDTDLNCKQEYCYQVIAYLDPTTPISYSIEKCETSPVDSDPLPIEELNITVINNIPTLLWEEPTDVKSYRWSRAVAGGSSVNLGTFKNNNGKKPDPTADPSLENCYQLTYTDNCDNTPENKSACQLTTTLNTVEGKTVNLSWTDYTDFNAGLSSYTVEFLDENLLPLALYENISGTTFTGPVPENLSSELNIRVKAISNDGKEVYSNIVTKTFYAQIFFPTAFTPNGDALNDTFLPKGQFIKDYELFVYTRQGELIFHSKNINQGWDGLLPNGRKATEGVYTFVAEVTGTIGNKFTKKGTFTLLN